jgi:hypothetical protein
MERKAPSRATLGILRKVGIGLFSGCLASFSLALLLAALPIGGAMKFELGYGRLGGRSSSRSF